MGYPKEYVGLYYPLAKWLSSLGHKVYPYEMICQPVPVRKKLPKWRQQSNKEIRYETHYFYGYVDVVSRFQGMLWAWEYKSKGDNILRALKQAKNYARSFNYVSVVVEDLANLDRHVRAEGAYVKTILANLGAGMCWNDEGRFKIIVEPKLQNPDVKLNKALMKRFSRFLGWKPRKLASADQRTKLTDFKTFKLLV